MVLLVYPAPWTRLRPQAQLEQANGSGSSRTGWIDEEGIPKFFEIPETLEIPKKHCGESRCLATPKMWIFLFVIPLSRWHTLVPFHFEVAASNTWLFMEEIRKPNQLKYIKKSLLIMEYSKPSQLLQPSFSSFFMTVVYISNWWISSIQPSWRQKVSFALVRERPRARWWQPEIRQNSPFGWCEIILQKILVDVHYQPPLNWWKPDFWWQPEIRQNSPFGWCEKKPSKNTDRCSLPTSPQLVNAKTHQLRLGSRYPMIL